MSHGYCLVSWLEAGGLDHLGFVSATMLASTCARFRFLAARFCPKCKCVTCPCQVVFDFQWATSRDQQIGDWSGGRWLCKRCFDASCDTGRENCFHTFSRSMYADVEGVQYQMRIIPYSSVDCDVYRASFNGKENRTTRKRSEFCAWG